MPHTQDLLVTRTPFGSAPDGTAVELFSFANARGTQCAVMSYGAAIVSLQVRDRSGSLGDVVLGCDSLAGYLAQPAYLGAVIGRYANRIRHGRFSLDGRTYQLATNAGSHALHGGIRGFDKVVWRAEPYQSRWGVGLVCEHTSPDGEESYPGGLRVTVAYALTDSDELVVDYSAEASAPTPLNLTQHSYFNLAGGGDVLGHEVLIDAEAFTPIDAALIPTGEIRPVDGTPFDFRKRTALGARINSEDPQLAFAGGYDHNFVLRRSGPGDHRAASVREPVTGRTLDVFTTEPGMQLYTGNFLNGSIIGKGGQRYGHRAGFCLETQHYPDSPNRPEFPSTILQPGQEYRSRTIFRFGVAH